MEWLTVKSLISILLVMQESLGKDPSFLEFIDKTGYKVVDGHQI